MLKKTRQYFILFVTVILLASAFCAYFFLHLPNQKQQLDGRHFRVLAQISKNAVDKATSYRINARLNAKNAIWLLNLKNNRIDLDPFKQKINEHLFNKNIQFIDVKKLKNPISIRPNTGVYDLTHSGGVYWLECLDTVTVNDTIYSFKFRFETNKFFESLHRPDQFESHLIVRNNDIIFPSPNHTGLQVVVGDSLLPTYNGLKTSTVANVNVGGLDYKLFLQPIRVASGHWMVGGLVKKENYESSKFSVSSYLIILLTVLLMIGLLAIPFLKLQVMSDCERLDRSDVLLAGISLIFGTALVTLLFFHLRTLCGPDYAVWSSEQDLVEISAVLQARLKQEIGEVLEEIKYCDGLLNDRLNDGSTAQPNSISVTGVGTESETAIIHEYDKRGKPSTILWKGGKTNHRYPWFNQLNWIQTVDVSSNERKAGDQVHKWTPQEKTSALINVSERSYFTKITEGNGWTITGISDPFYLQSIQALNSGRYEAAISTQSCIVNKEKQKPGLLAMTTELRSLINTVLPDGYGFCILNNDGKTLFHSDSELNLQENFIKETDHCSELLAAINARRSRFCEAHYHGGHYRMLIKPLWSTPLFLVTFHEREKLHAAHSQILSYSVIMFFLYLILAIVQLTVIAISLTSKSKLQSSRFVFHWLWPDREKTNRYVAVVVYHLLLFLGLGFCLHQLPTPSMKLSIILYSSLPLIVGSYFILHAEVVYWRDRLVKLFLLLPLLLGLVGVAMNWSIAWLWFLLVAIVSLSPAAFLIQGVQQKLDNGRSQTNNPTLDSHSYPYRLMLSTWLLAGAVMPILYFFSLTYNQEVKLLIKIRQYEFVNAWIDKHPEYLGAKPSTDSKSKSLIVDTLGVVHFDRDRVSVQTKDENASVKNEVYRPDKLFQKMYRGLRTSYNQLTTKTNEFVFDVGEEAVSGFWSKENGQLEYTRNFENKSLLVQSNLAEFNPIGLTPIWGQTPSKWLLTNKVVLMFWFVVPFLFALVFYLIRFTMRQSFALDAVERELYYDLTLAGNMLTKTSRHVFLAGLPYCGKSSFLQNQVKATFFDLVEYLNKSVVDRESYLAGHLRESEGTIIIDHFEYRIKELWANRVKLELVESLMQEHNQRIIIASTVELWHLFDSYLELERRKGIKRLAGEELKQAGYVADLVRWRNVFSNFVRLFKSLDKEPSPAHANPLLKLVDEECNHGRYLWSLHDPLLRYAGRITTPSDNLEKGNRQPQNEEEVILKIQSLAQSHYHSLWATCSSREKLLIYDLAEDGFINVKNAQTINALLKKGLLTTESGRLRLMNRSFQNFVLTAVERDDALERELNSINKGSWSRFRTPLMLILIGMAGFIFISERGSFNTIIALLGSFATALMVGIRMYDVIGSYSWKRSETNTNQVSTK